MDRLERSHEHACGGGPMVAVMKAARGARAPTGATVLRYADSGDAGERDKSRVVGYLSAALTRLGDERRPFARGAGAAELDAGRRRSAPAIARSALRRPLLGELPEPRPTPAPCAAGGAPS